MSSLSLLWWLALGVTAAAHLLWWPLLCFLRGISFCNSSAVSSSSYFCYGCCQLLLSLLGVSVQLVLVHLRFFHSVSCGWLPFWGSPAGCSFTGSAPLPPLDLVVISASGVLGGGGRAPSSGPSGFRRWVPSPFRRLSVPPLAGLEGQGCGALGCRGAAGGLLSALPQHSSSFQCSHPNAFFQPHLHQGGCSGGGHLGLHCQGCCGASSTPFSRLLQPSVRSVEDLGVMASGHRPLPYHRDTVYHFKALCFGLSPAQQVFTKVMALVSAILLSLGVRMRRYLDDWLIQSPSRGSLLGDLQTVLQLCHELGIVVNPQQSNLVPSRVVLCLGVVIDSASFRASPSAERISWLQSTAAEFQSCASPTARLWL